MKGCVHRIRTLSGVGATVRYTEETHLVFARFGDELTGDKDEKRGGEEQGDDQHAGPDRRLAASDLIVLWQVVYLAEDLRVKGRVSVARKVGSLRTVSNGQRHRPIV